jgi:hypothetical protein
LLHLVRGRITSDDCSPAKAVISLTTVGLGHLPAVGHGAACLSKQPNGRCLDGELG